MRSFDARVTAMFYQFVPSTINPAHSDKVDDWIENLGKEKSMDIIDQIRRTLFDPNEQLSMPIYPTLQYDGARAMGLRHHGSPDDREAVAHPLKLAIKLGDIGIIQRIFAQCCLLFPGTIRCSAKLHLQQASVPALKNFLKRHLVNMAMDDTRPKMLVRMSVIWLIESPSPSKNDQLAEQKGSNHLILFQTHWEESRSKL
jgi:hypothetical protein